MPVYDVSVTPSCNASWCYKIEADTLEEAQEIAIKMTIEAIKSHDLDYEAWGTESDDQDSETDN